MPNVYHPAPEVGKVAQGIISAHHGHLITNGVYVKFVFCEEPEKVKGREALGTARKVSGLNAYLALRHDPDAPRTGSFDGGGKLLVSEFFLITIYRDFWKSRDTTDHQRRALVDHELAHCWSEEQVDKDGQPTGKILLSLLPHDLEEFDIIAARYGAWRPDITAFLKAIRLGQPSLFDGEEMPGVSAVRQDVTVTLHGSDVPQLHTIAERLRAQTEGRVN